MNYEEYGKEISRIPEDCGYKVESRFRQSGASVRRRGECGCAHQQGGRGLMKMQTDFKGDAGMSTCSA